jgi:hypothetical protein
MEAGPMIESDAALDRNAADDDLFNEDTPGWIDLDTRRLPNEKVPERDCDHAVNSNCPHYT